MFFDLCYFSFQRLVIIGLFNNKIYIINLNYNLCFEKYKKIMEVLANNTKKLE